jgi:hypothetical protein
MPIIKFREDVIEQDDGMFVLPITKLLHAGEQKREQAGTLLPSGCKRGDISTICKHAPIITMRTDGGRTYDAVSGTVMKQLLAQFGYNILRCYSGGFAHVLQYDVLPLLSKGMHMSRHACLPVGNNL